MIGCAGEALNQAGPWSLSQQPDDGDQQQGECEEKHEKPQVTGLVELVAGVAPLVNAIRAPLNRGDGHILRRAAHLAMGEADKLVRTPSG